jgi:sulfite reductase alpha subunit-like flavoprotein
MTLDEYKKQIEAKKQAQHEKLPQFNRRTAGEGEDPNNWQNFKHVYRKKNPGEESNEEDLEEESGAEG